MREVGDVPQLAVMQDCEAYAIDWPSHWKTYASDSHLELQRAWNTLYHRHPDEKTYGLLTDHARPRSTWSKALEAAAGDWRIAFCKDNHERFNPRTAKRRIPGASCYGGKLVRAMGFVWPDFCTHMYGDDALEEIGYALELITVCEEARVDDLLSKKGETPVDDNNRRLWRGKPYVKTDGIAFADWMTHEKAPLVERLKYAINA